MSDPYKVHIDYIKERLQEISDNTKDLPKIRSTVTAHKWLIIVILTILTTMVSIHLR